MGIRVVPFIRDHRFVETILLREPVSAEEACALARELAAPANPTPAIVAGNRTRQRSGPDAEARWQPQQKAAKAKRQTTVEDG